MQRTGTVDPILHITSHDFFYFDPPSPISPAPAPTSDNHGSVLCIHALGFGDFCFNGCFFNPWKAITIRDALLQQLPLTHTPTSRSRTQAKDTGGAEPPLSPYRRELLNGPHATKAWGAGMTSMSRIVSKQVEPAEQERALRPRRQTPVPPGHH